jgi:UDP-N-acetylmuramoyl-tripeptide--D-alanyl-D-alanine ligase
VTTHRVVLWVRQEITARVLVRVRPVLCALAFVWRRILFRTTFVAITGSLGKTTAKDCVAACLAVRFRTACAPGSYNSDARLALNVLRVRPWHRYAVFEVSAGTPGGMAGRTPFIRPDIAIVLGVARTHTTAYPTLEAYAAEKARLIGALRPGGLAVLNADDARVAAMVPPTGCVVRRFGVREDSDVRGKVISARWPERLALRVSCAGETETVQTQLIGDHWMPVVLASLTVAYHAGVPLRDAATGLRQVPPVTGRLQPVRLPSGATVLRDDYHAAVDTLDAALRVLANAAAMRRILLVTDFSDFGRNRKHRLRYLARAAARSTDMVVLVGERAAYGGRRAVEAGMGPERVRAFRTLEETAGFLRSELGAGDLLLLKGRTSDHAARVFHALLGPIQCWKATCRRGILCDGCWELGARHADGRRAVLVLPRGVEDSQARH